MSWMKSLGEIGIRAPLVLALLASACGFHGSAGAQGDAAPGIDARTGDSVDPGAWLDGWTTRRTVTFHASFIEAPSDDALLDFPVMVTIGGSHPNLAFTASDHVTRLAHEIASIDATATIAWIKIPHLPATVDTVIDLYDRDEPAIAMAPASDVWSARFLAVYHLDGTSVDEVLDSTGLHPATTSHLDTDRIVPGRLGSALELNGHDSCITTPALDLGGQFTVSAWSHLADVDGIQTVMANSGDGSGTNGFRWFLNTSGSSNRRIVVETGNGIASATSASPDQTIVSDTWQHIAVIVDRTGGHVTTLVDGAVVNAGDDDVRQDFMTSATIEVGRMKTNNAYEGMLDEIEIATELRSIEWVRTSWRNQASPDTFYTLGAVTTRP